MKIVVQNRKTNAFLTNDARWAPRVEHARQFATSLEALRFCVGRRIANTDVLVRFPGVRPDLRLPLS